ncbi:MAG: Cna B-type domain-containing protein [Lachnospiraceae bacterium]|nr:Cna B-type domain-containing protein [Lachnospiraceae bacterium]
MRKQMKKEISKRIMAGTLAIALLAGSVGSPVNVYASDSVTAVNSEETLSYDTDLTHLEDVIALLQEDEVVNVADIEVEYGSDFDIENDFEGLEYTEGKVKLSLYVAKSESGYDFSTNREDTYQAVYYVEPVSGNPDYYVRRSVTVKNVEIETISVASVDAGDSSGDDAGTEDEDYGGDADPDPADEAASVDTQADEEKAAEAAQMEADGASASTEADTSDTEAVLTDSTPTEEQQESAIEGNVSSEIVEDSQTESGTDAGNETDVETSEAVNASESETEQASQGMTIAGLSETGTAATELEVGMTVAEETGVTEVQTVSDEEKSELETGSENESENESEVDTEIETETGTNDGIMLLSEEADGGSGLNENQSYVSGLAVKSLKDGTAPFDSDDKVGNDSSDSNHVVRTFDYVNYTLEYTTALMDTSRTVDEAYMMVEFTLNCDPSKAEFNTDTLNWCLDQVVTYVYADGTTSTSWESSKTVTAQVLTGKRYLSQNGDSNAIPGAGTLSVGIYVKAAQNGDVIQPTFTVWMEGNEENLSRTITGEAVTVTAAPRYNIRLTKSSNCNYLGYFDTEAGTVSDSDTEGSVYGRLEGYAITLQLYNTSSDKGLKGIELPTGELSFDLTLTESLDDEDVTGEENYTPILWDYRENESGGLYTTGYLGRQMGVGGKAISVYGVWVQPWNSGGATNTEYACYNGGSWSISQDSQSQNVYHVTVSGYSFDLEDLDFPTNTCGNTPGTIVYGANVGCFSAGYVQFVVQFARSVDTTSNLYFTVETGNVNAVSASGQATTVDQNSEDDKSGMNVTLYPKGSISKRSFFYTESGDQIASVWSYGDSYAYNGQTLRISSSLDYSGDGYLSSVNILQKFDDEAFEIPAGTTTYASMKVTNSKSSVGEVTVLFAAKPDKTGWASDAEMNATREEQLVYFDSIDALNAAGYTCVGFLYEVRNSQIYQGGGDPVALNFQMYVQVTSGAEIGTVYQTTNDVRCWSEETDVLSWTEVSYGNGAYGLGDSSFSEGSYTDGYATPAYKLYTNYGKSVYQDGSIVSGHSGGYIYGNSCLIIGCKTGVSIKVADKTATASGTTTKSVYDLDAGERTVTYVIHPSVSVVSANTEVGSSTDTTDVAITAILPSDLSYVMNSASLAPVSVVENEDGTSTITWLVENQTIGESMEDITLSCLIGEAGTANDVQNNDTLTIVATITSDKDDRSIIKAHGNYSETTISVIKLATSSVSKAVESALVEEGDSIIYIIRYGNSAEEDVDDVALFDILPYNGDGRDTSFSGSYAVDSITVDFSNAKETYSTVKDSMEIRWTGSDSARDISLAENILKGTDNLSWKAVSGSSTDGMAITWSDLALNDVAGLLFDIGTVKAQEYLKITVTLSVQDGSGNFLTDENGLSQNPGDIYANSFYEYASGQVAVVESNTVAAQVVERTISGLAWIDADSDGIRADAESLFSGIKVTLYRTSVSGYATSTKAAVTVNGVKLYTAYDVLGNEVDAVTTGKDGSYQFTDLESGTYYVVFGGMDGYGLTVQDAGEDDTVDSDATASIYEDGSGIEYAYISSISLPELDEMYAYLYESSHNDAGFISFTSGLMIQKVAEGTSVGLGGAVFVMKDSDGNYLTFLDGTYAGSREKVNADCYLTTASDGTVAVEGLPFGTYVLSEYQAPDGYQLTKETWKIKVQGKTTDSGWSSYVTVDGDTLDGALVVEDASETTTVTVTKAWKDNSNQDGLRTDVTLTLTGTVTTDAGEISTVVTKSGTIRANASKQEYTFTKLPVYASGLEVTYTVTEETVAGYETSYSALDGDWESGYSIVVTNTHTTETTEYTVVKVWDDDENRDGVRPETIEVKLIGSDGSERVAKLAEDAGWTYTFTDLPVYWKEGTAIKYTLEESPVSDYVREVSEADSTNQFTVTNTHEIATVDIPVEKIWDDSDDQDGVRADSITVILTGSDGSVREAVLTEESDWKYTYTDLPVYWNEGVAISYSLQEKAVDGYSDEVQVGTDGCSFVVTNNHIPAVTDLVIVKNWDDADNQDGIRPESIHVVLTGTDGGSYEADLTAENGYSCLFSGLPVYYDHGTTVVYSVTEDAVDGYQTVITADDSGYIFTVTNTHKPETVSVPVAKTWDDNDDQDGLRPAGISVTLTGSNGLSYEAELTEENGWQYTFEDVFVYWNEGETVEYTLTEAAVDGYQTEIVRGEDGYSFAVTNTHEPAVTEVNVKKIWVDDENRDGIRADFLHVTLTGSDGSSYEANLTGETGWAAVFTNLPVYFNHGELITYTIVEDSTLGYDAELVVSEDGYGFTFANTHETAKTDITVTKTWDDAEDQDGVRPDEVEVILTGSDGSRYSGILTEESGWTFVFTDLPVYWNCGETIEYSLQETAVDGYSDEIVKGEDGYTFTVTNIHIPAVTDVVILKEWDDDNDRDGVRPDSVYVTLTASDGNSYECELNYDNAYVCVLTDLAVYQNVGELITYTVTEEEVEGYESVVWTGEDPYAFILINTHTPQTKEIEVTKVWDDEEDKDGLRADVYLTLTGSDGTSYEGVIEKDSDTATYIFTDLPVYYDGGQEVVYSLFEAEMDGYTSSIEATDAGFTVTNTHTPETEAESESESETAAETSGDTSAPKTGDDSPLLLWIGIAWLGILGMVGGILLMRRRRRRTA